MKEVEDVLSYFTCFPVRFILGILRQLFELFLNVPTCVFV